MTKTLLFDDVAALCASKNLILRAHTSASGRTSYAIRATFLPQSFDRHYTGLDIVASIVERLDRIEDLRDSTLDSMIANFIGG
jgi:hypothetical protein